MTAGRSDAEPEHGEVRVARFDGVGGGAGEAAPVARFDEGGSEAGAVARRAGAADPAPSAAADLHGLRDAALPQAPVASLDGGDGPRDAAPIALFDAEQVAAARADAPVADMGDAALRGRGRRDGEGRRAGRAGGAGGAGRSTAERGSGPARPRPAAGAGAAGAGATGTDVAGGGVAGTDPAGTDVAGGGAAIARADVAAQALAAAEGRASRTRSGTDAPDTDTDTDTDTGRRRRARSDDAGPARGRSGSRWGASTELDPDADPVAVAREICLRLLTDRSRTRKELAQALRRRGVPDDAADTVLERFDEVGLIDDAAFAGQWVRSRHTGSRGLGRRALAVELRRKGVADDVAADALAEVDPTAEAERARQLVDRRLRGMTVTTAEERAVAGRRLAGMLARKGYGAGVAYGVVREALAAHGAEVEELGDADVVDD